MTTPQSSDPTARKPLRLWPGVVLSVLILLVRYGIPVLLPDLTFIGVFGGLIGGVAIVVWWLFFSRATWSERLVAVVLMILGLLATSRVIDKSITTGAMGMLFPILAVPVLALSFVGWAVATRPLSNWLRRVTMVATILLACGFWTLVRTGGFTANFNNDLTWRWAKSPEQRLLAQSANEPASVQSNAAPAVKSVAEWPGFRGPDRNGVTHGKRIDTDWSRSPPTELWRRPIGPGWSSFAVSGDLFYTQEQRGDDEVVGCYKLSTGEPVWKHRDSARFWESNAGPGPRATPTLAKGRVYTLGGTGILNALDAGTGAVVWSRNAATDTGKKVPGWGFAGSPLVVGDLVIVATAGALAAYDANTGDRRWLGPKEGGGYSSPHLATIDGVEQILLLNTSGATSVSPADGTVLWEHRWPGDGIVQTALTTNGDVLLGSATGMGGSRIGMRRVAVQHGSGGWTVEERWTSIGLRPYFNDFVVHKNHAYGFDGSLIACIDLTDGKRKWKGGRFGNGQLIVLADQDVLLVLSEQGDLALVGATPDDFKELAKIPAIKGKTWNHPVLVGDVLLVRNGEEMAAFRLRRV